MNKIAYYQGYMEKEAEGYGNVLTEAFAPTATNAVPLVGPLAALANAGGTLAGLVSDGKKPSEIDAG